MEEIWKDIPGYEGRYMASNLGRIKSMNYLAHEGNEQILKQYNTGKNYLHVRLYKDNKSYNFSVHRLIAKTFIDNYSEDLQIDHVDNNRQNNILSNLRLVTQIENMNNPNSNTIKPCRIYFNTGETKNFLSLTEAANYIGCSTSFICCYIKRKQGSRKYNFKKVEYI